MQCYKFMLLWQQNHHTILNLPKNIIFKNNIKREKTFVHVYNSFKLWMINTWLIHIKNKKSNCFSNLGYHGNKTWVYVKTSLQGN